MTDDYYIGVLKSKIKDLRIVDELMNPRRLGTVNKLGESWNM
jgi:hypothetical protein